VHRFGPNTTLVIPANAVHQIINVGAEPMTLTAALSTSPVAVTFPDGQPMPLPWKA
jgi:oxalate decarboxylase/phosphoglucose isomerase-like protein (cupin superfamily)